MPNVESMISTKRIICIKRYLSPSAASWKFFLDFYLRKVGGKFLFHCNFDYSKLSISLPDFYKECILSWASLTDNNPSSPSEISYQILWNNRFICINQGRSQDFFRRTHIFPNSVGRNYPPPPFHLRWPNTVFSYLCVIHRYFQPTGSWAAKIGKMQVQLKKLYFDMFYWTNYRFHGNTAVNKPALNNGFDLLSENSVVRSFPSFVSRKLRKILAF